MHVLIPLGRQVTYEQSRTLGELLARGRSASACPSIATIARAITTRGGKVYLDYLQNGHGQLLVAPFSVRPLPGAPVSMPLEWNEVNDDLRQSNWTIRTVPERLAKRKRDPWEGLLDLEPDLPAVLSRLADRARD